MTGADAIVIGTGPGVVGTGTRTGTSAMEVSTLIEAAAALGGFPIIAVRWSDRDERERHAGVSHHAITALQYAHAGVGVPVPRGEAERWARHDRNVLEVEVPDMAALLASHGLHVTTMGRGPDEDPGFFAYAGAAGVAAAQLLER
jgi:hypothetical protein